MPRRVDPGKTREGERESNHRPGMADAQFDEADERRLPAQRGGASRERARVQVDGADGQGSRHLESPISRGYASTAATLPSALSSTYVQKENPNKTIWFRWQLRRFG
jgi:hypothetical protein